MKFLGLHRLDDLYALPQSYYGEAVNMVIEAAGGEPVAELPAGWEED